MFSIGRLLFGSLNGRPVAQVIVGILLIPAGLLVSFFAASGDYIYPYWVVAGIAFAIFGVIYVIRGAITLLKPKPTLQQSMLNQTPYTGPNQYMPQQPYGQPTQPSYPYNQPQYPPQGQMPYSQPQQQPQYPAQNPYNQQ